LLVALYKGFFYYFYIFHNLFILIWEKTTHTQDRYASFKHHTFSKFVA